MSRVYEITREYYKVFLYNISAHKHMHTPEYQRPVALTHTTDLLGSPYEYPVCTHLRSRASYRSPSPITCEFIRRSRLSGPNSIYIGTCPSARVKPKKWKRGRVGHFFFFYCDLLPAWRSSGREVSNAKVPFDLLESCLKKLVGEKRFYFLCTNTWKAYKREKIKILHYMKLVFEICILPIYFFVKIATVKNRI